MGFSNPSYYTNREISWLEFDERVLEEAFDKKNAILERFKFLAISANNLDEFFMVRVSAIMDQVESNFEGKDVADLSPKEQLQLISKKTHELYLKQYSCLTRSLMPTLEQDGIKFLKYTQLNEQQLEFLDEYFETTIFPILTPMAIDQSRPFPHLNNKALNIIIELEGKVANEESLFAIMQIPTVIPRLIDLPVDDKEKKEFIFLEEVIKANVHMLFDGYNVKNKFCFRITRNSDFEIDEDEVEDLMKEIEDSVRKRRWGYPVRMEIEKTISKKSKKFLKASFELDDEDVYETPGPIDLNIFMSIAFIKGFSNLKEKPYTPVPSIGFLNKDCFEAIREKDILVHHPYESFDCVVNYVQTAAMDPYVLAIKQTLYRVSGNSPIINALIKAAENGKQVTVLVELKARFDEENNIVWAKKLEKAGCHVVYGLVGLKTHCKVCLVVRKEIDGIRRYVHLGTGNYNDSTAKIYTDLGYFTCKDYFGQDVSTLFNLLTGYSTNYEWRKISVAPVTLKDTFSKYIKNETKNAKAGKKAKIIAKMNSLVDPKIIKELYEASCAGVEIKLIVRGICCLRPKIKGVSENITVVSIVDRYLEHSRIFYFENDGNTKILLSSADWMTRNLYRRIEVAFPIEDESLKKRIMEILDITLSDTVKLRIAQPDGSYARVDKRGKTLIESQRVFEKLAKEKFNEFTKKDATEIFVPVYKVEEENEL